MTAMTSEREAMTLSDVRNTLGSWLGGSEACLDAPNVALLSSMIAAIDAHLSQPAQAVDVGFTISDSRPRILTWHGDNGCRPATEEECVLWEKLFALAEGGG